MKAVVAIRKQPSYRMEAFVAGLKRIGCTEFIDYRCGRVWPDSGDDVLLLWNLHRGPDEAYARMWEAKGGTVIVCENGYLQKVDKTHYAMSTHGHNGSGWFPNPGDGRERFERLGFDIKPERDPVLTGVVLVRGQRGIGSQMMHSPPRWHDKHAQLLRSKGHKVIVMEHPGDKGKLEADAAALAKADEVHIWCSAIGVRALLEGIPVRHHAPRWICAGWEVGGREYALHNMACAQWHHEEIATGEPFARMKAEGWGIFGAGAVKAPTRMTA